MTPGSQTDKGQLIALNSYDKGMLRFQLFIIILRENKYFTHLLYNSYI